MTRTWMRDALLASCAGYGATVVMERAANALYERESEPARQREDELRQEMPTTTLVRKVAAGLDRKLDDERTNQLGMWVHYGFGASGGPAAVALMAATRLSPMAAGLAVGTGMWVFVDEGANTLLGLTPPPTAFPLVTHARALAAHLVYGIVLGSLLAGGRRVTR
jgi:hypothetical protein